MANCRISIIIPNRNGEKTIDLCLKAVFASRHDSFEVIVVDDCSEDSSREIISLYPCKLVKLGKHAGASTARNIGAGHSRGRILFFTDADCLLQEDTLRRIEQAVSDHGPETLIGGTYTRVPYDDSFYSMFQSVFVNFSETKHCNTPDYITSHAMVISADNFKRSKGFPEQFLPIIEDVEFSHRLHRQGKKMVIEPNIEVRHIFNFSFTTSFKNAFRKSKYWTIYSLDNRDLFTDSGCASYELKINVMLLGAALAATLAVLISPGTLAASTILLPFIANMAVSRRLLYQYFTTGGVRFALFATLYFLLPYAIAVACGAISGISNYPFIFRDFPLGHKLLWQPEK